MSKQTVFLYGNARYERKLRACFSGSGIVIVTSESLSHAITIVKGHTPKKDDVFVLSVAVVGQDSQVWNELRIMATSGVRVCVITKRDVPDNVRAYSSMDRLIEEMRQGNHSLYSQSWQAFKVVVGRGQKQRTRAYDNLQPRLFD